MKKGSVLRYLLAATLIFVVSCNGGSEGTDESSGLPMDKKYWAVEDYHTANNLLTSLYYNKSELPNLDNPKTSSIFNKIVDTANIGVITNDDQLGITHREEFLKNMFEEYKTFAEKYTSLDKRDKYIYPSELVKILKFGLYFQVPYIQIGNEKILKESTNPDDGETKSLVSTNQQTLIKNYNIYLDQINFEDRFSDKALEEYSQGINEYFPKLITMILPNADYSETHDLVQNMLKKAKNASLIKSLQNIDSLTKDKSKKPN